MTADEPALQSLARLLETWQAWSLAGTSVNAARRAAEAGDDERAADLREIADREATTSPLAAQHLDQVAATEEHASGSTDTERYRRAAGRWNPDHRPAVADGPAVEEVAADAVVPIAVDEEERAAQLARWHADDAAEDVDAEGCSR